MPERSALVRVDATLKAAVDVAREAVLSIARPGHVGDYIGFHMDDVRLGTHFFECADPGYRGWKWMASVARVPRGRHVSICEVDLIPGEGALLAPEWVPWEERLRPGDYTRGDVIPFKEEDERLEAGCADTSEDPDLPLIRELGLGRARVLSAQGVDEAVRRWYSSAQGPKRGRIPADTCSTCGFLVKMSGSLRTIFGVCANGWAQDDGRVVSLDHTCGAHSETDVAKGGPEWVVRPSRIDDCAVESEPLD